MNKLTYYMAGPKADGDVEKPLRMFDQLWDQLITVPSFRSVDELVGELAPHARVGTSGNSEVVRITVEVVPESELDIYAPFKETRQ